MIYSQRLRVKDGLTAGFSLSSLDIQTETLLTLSPSLYGIPHRTFSCCCHVVNSVPVFSLFPLQVGLLLSSFTMKFYFCQGQQRSSSSMMVYLKNLMAADFFLCLCLPFIITKYSSSSITIHMIYSNYGCSAFYLNMYASILLMGYIAANRYLKIVHPSQTHILQTVRSAHIISTVTWVFLLVIMIAYITLSHLTQPQLTSVSDRCEVLLSTQIIAFYKIIHVCSASVFLFVLISLVVFYYNSSHRVLLAQQRQPTSSDSKKLVKSRRNVFRASQRLLSFLCAPPPGSPSLCLPVEEV
uniref:G-protein coupled receptors family 1 profile domain-containing protein n=1 Tax=Lates calcarifer TaxID=8187 RepID=A0A4W6C324_LATCA